MSKKGKFDLSTSSDDSGTERMDRQQSTRITNKPPRLGIDDCENRILFSLSGDSQEEPFASDETIDEYLPEPLRKKRKKMNANCLNFNGTQSRHAQQKSSQKSLNSIESQKANVQNGAYDFDSQFDSISNGMQLSTASSCENTSAENIASHISSNEMKTGEKNVNEKNPAQSDILNDVDAVACFAKQINSKLNEILARVATLEKTVIASATNSSSKDLMRVPDQLHSEAELFIKSNSLPTENLNEIKRFDENLRDPVYFTATVSARVIIK